MTGRKSDAERAQGAGDAPCDCLGTIDGVELRHHLAGHELGGGDQHEGDDRRDRHGDAMAEDFTQGRPQDGGQRRLAQRSDADRGQRHADLHGGDVLVDVGELLERERRPLGALLAHHFKLCAARAHERVLGDHEEGVDRDQQGRDDEL